MDEITIQTVFEMLLERGATKKALTRLYETIIAPDCITAIDIGRINLVLVTYSKSGVKETRLAVEECKKNSKNIIVFVSPLTTFSSRMIEENRNLVNIEVWTSSDLICNPCAHFLCPKHEILTPQEKEEVLNSLKVNSGEVPKILANDPVVRFKGAREEP